MPDRVLTQAVHNDVEERTTFPSLASNTQTSGKGPVDTLITGNKGRGMGVMVCLCGGL